MDSLEPELLFRRYQRSGDPELLAAVFDRTAAQLLVLAVHFVKEQARAEDLVQATFVRVIERADSYDSSRPFLPWISAVLANEARMLLRRERRAIDASRLAREPAPDPATVAELGEAAELLGEALERLPETYRSVLRLKLLHGLRHVEISRALDLTQEAVRTRCHRGLQRLRALLPAGLAGTVMLLVQGRGLASVRTAVLAEAVRRRALTAVVPAWVASVAIVLGLGGLVWLFFGLWAQPSSQVPAQDRLHEHRAEHGERRLPHLARAREPAPGERAPSRSSAAGEPRSHAAASAPGWELRGTVRDAEGRPVSGAEVRVALVWGSEEAPACTTTASADGRYRAPLAALATRNRHERVLTSFLVRARDGDGRESEVELIEGSSFQSDTPTTLPCDLRLGSIATLRGRCVGAGLARPGAGHVVLRAEGDAFRQVTALLGPDGAFRLRVPAEGDYQLEALAAAGIARLPLPGLRRDEDRDLGVLELDPHGVVRGRLLGSNGTPFDFVSLELQQTEGASPLPTSPSTEAGRTRVMAYSDASGEFSVAGLAHGSYRLLVPRLGAAPLEFSLETGRPPVELRIPGQLLHLRTTGEDGTPYPDIPVSFARCSPGGDPAAPAVHDLCFHTGVHRLLLPASSEWQFRARHWSAGRGQCRWKAVAGVDHAQVDLVLRPAPGLGELDLRLRDDSGRRALDFELELFDAESLTSLVIFDPAALQSADGKIRLSAGSYLLSARTPDVNHGAMPVRLPWSGELQVRAGETQLLHGELQPGARVRLQPLLPDGEQVAGWRRLRALLMDGEGQLVRSLQPRHTQSPSDGLWRYCETPSCHEAVWSPVVLAPGRYWLRVESLGFRSQDVAVVLQPGNENEVRVPMHRSR